MNILVSVYLNTAAMSANKKIFSRSVDWDSSLAFPFDQTVCTLRTLFGCYSVVVFQIMPIC